MFALSYLSRIEIFFILYLCVRIEWQMAVPFCGYIFHDVLKSCYVWGLFIEMEFTGAFLYVDVRIEILYYMFLYYPKIIIIFEINSIVFNDNLFISTLKYMLFHFI